MRWVLFRPENQSLFYDPETQEPLGLEYLSAMLTGLGCDVLILDSVLDNLNNIKLARRAVSFKPDAIGVSITTDRELDSVLSTYAECKRLTTDRQVHWFAGGNYVTCEYRNACEALPEDIRLVKYDGELFVKKVYDLWNDGLINTLPRLSDGEPVENMDELPFPQRPYHYYLKHFGWAFNVQGSRGCCSACKYCASSGMRGHGRYPWRGRSPEHMVDELIFLNQNFGAQTFNFVDEDFLGPPIRALNRAKRFTDAVKAAKLNMTFGIQVRPNALSEEIIDTLADAGLKYVFMGIESDNPEDLKRWGRAYCANTWSLVRYLQKKEIEVNAGTLLFHPESTFEGIRTFATKLKEHGLLNFRTAVNRMDAIPGSIYHDEYMADHPNEQSKGSIQLPFNHSEIESFYETLIQVLQPIEAPSMHALCAMPIAQTNRFFKNEDDSFQLLKRINNSCDTAVSDCFFLLLDWYEKGAVPNPIIDVIRNGNRAFGREIADLLVENGFVESPESLFQTVG